MTGTAEIKKIGVTAPQEYSDVVAKKEIRRTRLKGTTHYQYCPTCYKNARRLGLDYTKACKPLWSVTYRVLVRKSGGNIGRVMFDDVLECETCRKEVTVNDFYDAYVDKSAGAVRYKNEFELTDENMARYKFVTAEKPKELMLQF